MGLFDFFKWTFIFEILDLQKSCWAQEVLIYHSISLNVNILYNLGSFG